MTGVSEQDKLVLYLWCVGGCEVGFWWPWIVRLLMGVGVELHLFGTRRTIRWGAQYFIFIVLSLVVSGVIAVILLPLLISNFARPDLGASASAFAYGFAVVSLIFEFVRGAREKREAAGRTGE